MGHINTQVENVSERAPVDNLALWNVLSRTNPAHTKPFTKSGFNGTQIDPVGRMLMMTEVFGPIGKGWGYEQLEHIITEGMVFICVRCWWKDPETGDKCWTGPQWGGDVLFKTRKNGPAVPNDEAFKMAMTDAVGKALVPLGVAADIYLGQFDDSKYRQESEAFYAAKGNGWTEISVARFERDITKELAEAANLDAYEALKAEKAAAAMKEIKAVDKKAWQRIVEAFSARKKELELAAQAATADDDEVEQDETQVDPATHPVAFELEITKAIAQISTVADLQRFYHSKESGIKQARESNEKVGKSILTKIGVRKKELEAAAAEKVDQEQTDARVEPPVEQPEPKQEAVPIDEPWIIDVPKLPNGDHAWDAFVDEMLRVISTIRDEAWGAKFVELNRAQVTALSKVGGDIRTVNGHIQTGKEAANRIKQAMQRRFDELAPLAAE